MRQVGFLGAHALVLVLAATVGGPAQAQETLEDASVAADAALPDEDLLGEDELDELVAPVALYPDSLLTQIFVAATFPLDVMKAERFVAENAEVPDAERADLAEQEDWDPSIQVLAGGFPSVIERMADDIEWTEDLGDAVLAQTDDVLDAVQRMRSRAVATGYLESNEAQVVEEEEDQISIAPADPEVVYVPSYDSAAAFTSAPTAAPVVYATDDPGWSAGEVLTTGAIAFGGAMILDEIFEDDDDDWDDYWRGPPPVDWDDGDFYPRGGVNVDGDVNIDRGDRNVDRDRVDVDRDVVSGKIGSVDRDSVDARKDGAFRPSDDRKAAARDNIAGKKEARGEGVSGAREAAARDKVKNREASGGDARAKLDKATANRKPSQPKADKATALKAKAKDRPDVDRTKDRAKTDKAKDRSHKSVDKSAGAGKAKAAKANAQARDRPKAAPAKAAQAHPKKNVAKANKPKPQAKKAPKKTSALKQKSGGAKAKKAKSRGNKSNAKRRR